MYLFEKYGCAFFKMQDFVRCSADVPTIVENVGMYTLYYKGLEFQIHFQTLGLGNVLTPMAIVNINISVETCECVNSQIISKRLGNTPLLQTCIPIELGELIQNVEVYKQLHNKIK
jgi:hypothetical protein